MITTIKELRSGQEGDEILLHGRCWNVTVLPSSVLIQLGDASSRQPLKLLIMAVTPQYTEAKKLRQGDAVQIAGTLQSYQQDGACVVGRLEVRDTFTIPKIGTLVGCMVLDGYVTRTSLVRIFRDGQRIHAGKIASLRRFEDNVNEVERGYECGLSVEDYSDWKVDDIIEVHFRENRGEDVSVQQIELCAADLVPGVPRSQPQPQHNWRYRKST